MKDSGTNNNSSNNSNNNTSNSAPLKDNSNIKPRKSLENQTPSPPPLTNQPSRANVKQSPETSVNNQRITNRKFVPSLNNQNLIPKPSTPSIASERALKCLETLAQKAGAPIKETIILPKMDKAQTQTQQVPIQISPEQLQQLQHQFQMQQAYAAGGATAIQVKQEFPQNQATIEQLNKQLQEQNQAAQVQQMQLIETATSQHQQQNNAMGIKYVNGKFLVEKRKSKHISW